MKRIETSHTNEVNKNQQCSTYDLYGPILGGKACNGICKDFVPARDETVTKNLHYVKLSPDAGTTWVYYTETSYTSLKF